MSWIRTHASFANVTSLLALFVALGGGAYAATALPKNSVGTKQLKSNAVTTAKVKNGTLSLQDLSSAAALALKGTPGAPGPQGPAGQPGAPGEQGQKGDTGAAGPTIRWALFNSDGTVNKQSGGISLTTKGTSDYFIDMGTTVTGHALLASVSQKDGGSGTKILAAPCGSSSDDSDCAPSIGATANSDGHHVHVYTVDGVTSTPVAFYIVTFP